MTPPMSEARLAEIDNLITRPAFESRSHVDDKNQAIKELREEVRRLRESSGPRTPTCPTHKSLMKHGEENGIAFWKCCEDDCPLFISDHIIKSAEQFFGTGQGQASAQHIVSSTFGDLPENVQKMIEPHEWGNMTASEQRDWAVEKLAAPGTHGQAEKVEGRGVMNIYKDVGCSQEQHLPNCSHFGMSGAYLSEHAPDCPWKKHQPCNCNPKARRESTKGDQ